MSQTPDNSKKAWLGVTPSPMPFYTPRPERRRLESRGFDANANRQEKERELNVQVVLRCRPLNDDELRLNVPKVLTCNEQKREVIVANKQVDRVFTFDKVFGPKAQQRAIYDQSISPIVNEVLEGFNCTVFAYGQTGTGKTYTMEGGMRSKNGDLPADAGVIPRAVRQIFDTLEAQNADYSMKVTFLELYNEEITDLLANDENPRALEEKFRKPISLMEDGKGCVIVRGLEEEAVYSANEIYNLLERGASKRRTADTLLNKRSSRSHSIFSITIHVKEASIGDEDIIKCGKLNLVDLAGSENISRSGAREGRAREAGEINKSLLTLGRVINTLVEHSAHIPYRDSKLTRLLRDSLGGKTKTCIIATISTSAQSLEETLSTLDYAYRAKNIKNKPEANQKMSKAVLLKDLYLEIEKMKQDVRAAREKNGVYIPHERFSQDEAEKKARNEKIEQLEIDLSLRKKEVDQFRELYLAEREDKLELDSELKCCKVSLEESNQTLDHLQEKHRLAVSTLKERDFIISKLLHSENSLINRAKAMQTNLQSATDDISSLFTKLDQKNELESENHGMLLTFGSHLEQSLKDLHKAVLGSVSQQQQQIVSMEEHITTFFASKYDATRQLESRITKMRKAYNSGLTTLKDIADILQTTASTDIEEIKSTMACQTTTLETLLTKAASEAKDVTRDLQTTLNEQKQILVFSAQQQLEGLHRSMISTEIISRATINFYNDLSCRSSELMQLIEEIQITKTHQLQTFENVFKEEAVREEKQAMEKIAEILASLTSKRAAQVSEASRNIGEFTIQENKILLQRISNMQEITSDAKEKMNIHLDTSKRWFLEDTFSAAENLVNMESCLDECTKTVNQSTQQWENMQFSIQNHNHRSIAEIASIVKNKVRLWEDVHQQFASTTSFINENVEADASETLEAVNDSLMLDQQAEREIKSISALCSDELKCLKGKHRETIANIRNKAEQCLTKDFLIDTHPIPKKNVIEVPSLKSIEEMRTPAIEELIQQQKSKSGSAEKPKIIQQQKPFVEISPNRIPFAHVN